MVKYALVSFCIFLPQFQDKPVERLVFELPDFYLGLNANQFPQFTPALKPCPKDKARTYAVIPLNQYDEKREEILEYEESKFYALAISTLRYGVLDNGNITPMLNRSYIRFVAGLCASGILTEKSLSEIADWYASTNWTESLYCLNGVNPGIIGKKQWEKYYFESIKARGVGSYLTTLAALKAGEDPQNLYRDAKAKMNRDQWPIEYLKTCAVLFEYGVVIEREVRLQLLAGYLVRDPECSRDPNQIFVLHGLPRFSADEPGFKDILINHVRSQEKETPALVTLLRSSGCEFPKERVQKYLTLLLENYGDIEDIAYLIRAGGDEPKPEEWKRYADNAASWHKSRKRLNGHCETRCLKDAIFGYRKALEKKVDGVHIAESMIDYLLGEFESEPIPVIDMAFLYELKGLNPKADFIRSKIEACIEKRRSLKFGAHYKDQEIIVWSVDCYGDRLLPFKEEIEWVFYLGDPIRTRELSDRICAYLIQRLKYEGVELKQFAKPPPIRKPRNVKLKLHFGIVVEIPETPKFEFLGFVLQIDPPAFEFRGPLGVLIKIPQMTRELWLGYLLRKTDTPALQELNEILQTYIDLDFKIGARSLAQHLMEYGFHLHSRRAFEIAGLKKEAEEQCFSKRSNDYWRYRDSNYFYAIRK